MPDDRDVYEQVARLHVACLDQGFLSTLGTRVLTLLYSAIDKSPASSLHVEVRDGRIVGFVASSRGMRPIFLQMLLHPFLLVTALVPLVLHPRKIMGILEVLRYGHGQHSDATNYLPEYELLSIAVAPEFRGSGVAGRLYAALVGHLRERQISAFRIVVGDALTPAHRFYRRMGAEPRSRIEVHRGQGSVVYVHRIT